MARTRKAWKIADPVERDQRKHFSNARSQAKFRNESWDLTYEKWREIWGSYWHNRGKRSSQYCLVLIDPNQGWTESNVMIQTRKEWLIRIKTKEKTL